MESGIFFFLKSIAPGLRRLETLVNSFNRWIYDGVALMVAGTRAIVLLCVIVEVLIVNFYGVNVGFLL